MPPIPQRDPPTTHELLNITTDTRVWVAGHDADAKRSIERLVTDTARPTTGSIDVAVITPLTLEEAIYFAGKIKRRLSSDGCVWVVRTISEGSAHFEQNDLIRAMAAIGLVECGFVESNPQFRVIRFRQPPADGSGATVNQ